MIPHRHGSVSTVVAHDTAPSWLMILHCRGSVSTVVAHARGGGTSTHNKRGCAILTKKGSTQKSRNLPKIETQKSGNLPKIETQKSGNPKHHAFLLCEKTYHPGQKVLDINSTFQFYLFYQRILLFNFRFMMFVQGVLNFPQPLSV